jgi:alkanesulfonate monooxygenase SsuD/methylene tetrahydromethanopterin reductase-like flavin-dependent oxidoreductase (luciferase family)
MLDLIGRKGDGWVPSASWAPFEDLGAYQQAIDQSAARAGRDPSSIRRVYNVGGSIGAVAIERFRGSPDQWVGELTEAIGLGMDTFVFWPEGDDRADQVRRFAETIVPGVRSAAGF